MKRETKMNESEKWREGGRERGDEEMRNGEREGDDGEDD